MVLISVLGNEFPGSSVISEHRYRVSFYHHHPPQGSFSASWYLQRHTWISPLALQSSFIGFISFCLRFHCLGFIIFPKSFRIKQFEHAKYSNAWSLGFTDECRTNGTPLPSNCFLTGLVNCQGSLSTSRHRYWMHQVQALFRECHHQQC